ncbi:MAG: hypothetical protein K2Z81_05360, partial [Cyanobacteria bacterium]|nr:hypothetical protein [Cyanobacteriota bacterium]
MNTGTKRKRKHVGLEIILLEDRLTPSGLTINMYQPDEVDYEGFALTGTVEGGSGQLTGTISYGDNQAGEALSFFDD